MNPLDPTNTESTRRRRSTKRATGAPPPRRLRQVVAMTEAEYRELIQKHVNQARADQSIAERLAEEARLRFEIEIDEPEGTE